jgi:dTDP-4-dehydrorhamnose reductase
MRILLTGASGQIGGALRQPLGQIGEVLTPNRSVLDLGHPDSLSARLDELSPDLIINPAAYTAVDLAEDERELAYRVNAVAPRIIAAWASNREVPMVHFSTDYVFNGSGDRPWREDDPTDPLSVYGAGKSRERPLFVMPPAVTLSSAPLGFLHPEARTSWPLSQD